MALFIGFLIIVVLLAWAISLDLLGIILCSLFIYFLISRHNTPQTEIGWIMLVVMVVGIIISIASQSGKRNEW